MTSNQTIADLAMKTKDELLRRGPVRGSLSVATIVELPEWKPGETYNANYSIAGRSAAEEALAVDGKLVWEADPADCPVCLLGAAGAAHFGDPDKGYVNEDPNHDGDADYAAFIGALASLIDEKHNGGLREDFLSDNAVVFSFFDALLNDISGDDPRLDHRAEVAPAIELLDELASRYTDTEEAA